MANIVALDFVDLAPVLGREELQQALEKSEPLLHKIWQENPRYQDSLGWLAVDETAGPERIAFLQRQAEHIRSDADVFVVIGVGGSNQAARAAITALQPKGGPDILWAGNTISAYEMQTTLEKLDSYKSVYINCIAKNFETLEPGIAFRVLRQYLEKRYGAEGAAKRIVATGTPGSSLEALCTDNGYVFLQFPFRVGGRFSVGSDVALFPMAVAGIDIAAMVQGMRNMRSRLEQEKAKDNIALRYAMIRKLMLRHGYSLEMMSFFEPRLQYLCKWWVQLFAESEGKQNTALYPVVASNSEDLHATGQFVQEGNPILFETFVEVMKQDASFLLPRDDKKDFFDYLAGQDLWDMNKVALKATLKAHSERGIPCVHIKIPAIDAHTLGELFYFFMLSCYVSCELLEVNPFDQPGVEAYKKYMFAYLQKPGAE